MAKFKVEILEILCKAVEIEAETEEEAIEIAEGKVNAEEIVLDWQDFLTRNFDIVHY